MRALQLVALLAAGALTAAPLVAGDAYGTLECAPDKATLHLKSEVKLVQQGLEPASVDIPRQLCKLSFPAASCAAHRPDVAMPSADAIAKVAAPQKLVLVLKMGVGSPFAGDRAQILTQVGLQAGQHPRSTPQTAPPQPAARLDLAAPRRPPAATGKSRAAGHLAHALGVPSPWLWLLAQRQVVADAAEHGGLQVVLLVDRSEWTKAGNYAEAHEALPPALKPLVNGAGLCAARGGVLRHGRFRSRPLSLTAGFAHGSFRP